MSLHYSDSTLQRSGILQATCTCPALGCGQENYSSRHVQLQAQGKPHRQAAVLVYTFLVVVVVVLQTELSTFHILRKHSSTELIPFSDRLKISWPQWI